MAKIGVSLLWDYISGRLLTVGAAVLTEILGPASSGLRFPKDHGVSSIELRHRHPEINREDMRAAFLRLVNTELDFTIHGEDPPQADDLNLSNICPWLQTLEEIDAGVIGISSSLSIQLPAAERSWIFGRKRWSSSLAS